MSEEWTPPDRREKLDVWGERAYRPPPEDGYMRGRDLEINLRPVDPETGERPVPKEGDDPSPWTCPACEYEHPMHWVDFWPERPKGKPNGKFLVCYNCDNFALIDKPKPKSD